MIQLKSPTFQRELMNMQIQTLISLTENIVDLKQFIRIGLASQFDA